MEDKFIQEFKVMLEAKQADIIKQLGSIGSKSAGAEVNFDAKFPDYGNSASIEDNASEVSDYTTNLSLERDLESELHSVEKALKSMAEGKYGVCKYCNKEFSDRRNRWRHEKTICKVKSETINNSNNTNNKNNKNNSQRLASRSR